jgi:AraC family transcriptional regulator
MPRLKYGWYDGGPAARAMIDLLRTARNDALNHGKTVDTALADVLATVSADDDARSTAQPGWIKDLKAHIDACPADAVSVQALAETHRLHPVSMARAFRRHVGCSITNYLRRRRITEACRLMESGECDLAEIALHTGFSDQAHLTRMFRKELGLPPARFRRITA